MGSAPKQSHKSQSGSASLPKKRRRRTVVTGAAEDCFTCAKRGTQCDRRRPYCSQCIGLGQECSGYKTTLTWGVGVASRGKLRGLSLPVTGSRPATIPPKPSRLAGLPHHTQLTNACLSTSGGEYSKLATPAYTTYGTETVGLNTSMHQLQNPNPSVFENTPLKTNMCDSRVCPSIPAGYPYGGDQLRNSNHHSANTQETISPNHSFLSAEGNKQSRIPPESDTSMDSIQNLSETPQVPSKANQFQPIHARQTQELKAAQADEKNHIETMEEPYPYNPMWVASHSPSFSQLLLARSVGHTPRLKYLISYYMEVIAPVIVAFDSPTSPFRTQILMLAEESESLQEAIATLSTNNLRQRRQARTIATGRTLPSRMSSLALRALTENTFEDQQDLPIVQGLTREEHYHRGMAVRALNAELADPHRRLSDSVLATLFMLCLFHISDTGIAQFKTQFAGVKKLLAIRMRNLGTVADNMKWFVRLFTWLDTLTATTNDREIQLGSACLDITSLSGEEWSLENLTGCDSSLFKLVAQLGRLNLLSQNQVVKAPTPPDLVAATPTLPAPMLNPIYGAGLPAPNQINSYELPLPSQPLASHQSRQSPSPAFWSEWFSLRQKLEAWRPGPCIDDPAFSSSQHVTPQITPQAYMSPPSSPNSQYLVAPENIADVFNISEAFRHSAILYCERLAYPGLPSSHPRIQNIVQMVMRHVSAVQSDVFLLWPLFIAGSECVLEEHRREIRNRCTDISKDSGFFNNLSCLELLEEIWATNLDETGDGNQGSYGVPHGQPLGDAMSAFTGSNAQLDSAQLRAPGEHVFRWSRVMQAKRVDGEYIVV
ncbi:hypothetical protein PHISCL_04803 [Aspergillus sclerotialis]|uniref:Zn(2)-C6 fungal-type domain-containing protein n=1 Tax=Aspergillus sclerotialis TaxID=2070753 RepID=A0A3A2ZHZ7_9EURO|nr:hypothetical protein PHISCL_04803 [Aspergillus sclerotialis]